MKRLFHAIGIIAAIFITAGLLSCIDDVDSADPATPGDTSSTTDSPSASAPDTAAVSDVTCLTAIFYGGAAHLSWQNPAGDFAAAEIFSGGEKIGEGQNRTSSVYGSYAFFTDEDSYEGKSYLVRARDTAGQLSGGMTVDAAATGLPVVMIETEESQDILDTTNKINAALSVFNTDEKSPDADSVCTIKGRGNSSWGMPKKSYTVKLDSGSKMLGMKKHKTWAFVANYADKTLLRNSIAYQAGRQIFTNMAWNPTSKPVHFFLNGAYLGVYGVTESAKIDDNRVNIKNIEKCAAVSAAGDYGFLLEANGRLDENFNFTTTRGVPFSLKDPDGEDISEELRGWIQETAQNAEDALYSDDFNDSESQNYWEKYFDAASFIDWWLVNEIAKNNDAIFYSSCYMYFDPADSKFHMGPLWDFDIGFGNVNYNGNDSAEGFWIKNAKWISRMFEDGAFVKKAQARWTETYGSLSAFFNDDVKKQFDEISPDANVNFMRWPILGIYVWPNPAGYANRTTYASECEYFNNWISERLAWLNTAVNGL